jgi:hypothetical protein
LQKGVNITEIENKKVATENKLEELDKRLEDLPNVREGLVAKYREEKEMQLKVNEGRDYLGERSVENSPLFSVMKQQEIEKEIKENVQTVFGRKR